MMPIMTPYRTPYNKLKQQRGLQAWICLGNIGILQNSNAPLPALKSATLIKDLFASLYGRFSFSFVTFQNISHLWGFGEVKRLKQSALGVLEFLVVIPFRTPPFKGSASYETLTGGLVTMPLITSNRFVTVNLPADSFIQSINATSSAGDWIAYIRTTRDQFAPICNTQGKPLRFQTLDSLAHYLADAGLCEFDVSLLGLGGAQ